MPFAYWGRSNDLLSSLKTLCTLLVKAVTVAMKENGLVTWVALIVI